MARQLKISWHDALLKCVTPHTDAPDRFIIWSAFSVIGAVLKNRCYIDTGLYKLYPNQYIILVSPPGIGKGTAINFAWKIVKDTAPNYLANMVSDRVTAPRILERIANGWSTPAAQVLNGQIVVGTKMDHCATIYSTELRVLIGASDWMLEFLCESWDRNSYDYDTKNKGSAIISEMCTSLIGGTVPDYLKRIDRDSDISVKGGFTSRCLFIYEDKPSRFMPSPPPLSSNSSSTSLLAMLKVDLEHIAQTIKGEFTYDTSARVLYEDFLSKLRKNIEDDDEAIANFKSRARAHVLKLAMILSASRKDDLVIDRIDMQAAISHIQKVLEDIERVFRGMGDSELAASTSRVQNYLERVGIASKKDLLRHMHRHMTDETLGRILYLLETIGYLEVLSQNKITMYKHIGQNGRVKP